MARSAKSRVRLRSWQSLEVTSIDQEPRRFYICCMPRLTFLRQFGFGWFALVLCLSSAADLVIDLAFEVPAVAAEEGTASSEPDNAAEHVLMPSPRGDGGSVPAISVPVLDLLSNAISVECVGEGQLEARSTSPPSFCNRPIAFNVPLRI